MPTASSTDLPTFDASRDSGSASYAGLVKVITQREFRDNSAAVMDTVEAGEIYRVTRNGVEVAELRPIPRRRRLTADELVQRHRGLPRVEVVSTYEDAYEFFGAEDRVGADDPWSRG